jgi:hypothetical protein
MHQTSFYLSIEKEPVDWSSRKNIVGTISNMYMSHLNVLLSDIVVFFLAKGIFRYRAKNIYSSSQEENISKYIQRDISNIVI